MHTILASQPACIDYASSCWELNSDNRYDGCDIFFRDYALPWSLPVPHNWVKHTRRRRTRGGGMLPMLAVGWQASALRVEEAGRFREVAVVAIVDAGCLAVDTLTVDSGLNKLYFNCGMSLLLGGNFITSLPSPFHDVIKSMHFILPFIQIVWNVGIYWYKDYEHDVNTGVVFYTCTL